MMRANLLYIVVVVFCLFVVLVLPPNTATNNRTLLATPTPRIGERFLFTDNTCEAPCWFGITPDVSTSEDVANFIEMELNNGGPDLNSDIDPQTGLVINGAYSFFLGPHYDEFREERGVPLDSYIAIDDSLVKRILIWSNQIITSRQVIAFWGEPDFVYLTENQISYLEFIYTDKFTRVRLKHYPKYEPTSTDSCLDIYWVEFFQFFSVEAAYEPVQIPDSGSQVNGHDTGEPQPVLLAAGTLFQSYVISPETLPLLDGDSEARCAALRENLVEATAVPMPAELPEITETPDR
jgi:hypothetical protein